MASLFILLPVIAKYRSNKGDKMDNIVNIISSVGFPIAMALLLFWYMTKQNESHREETNGLKDAITKLEIAITSLINKLND